MCDPNSERSFAAAVAPGSSGLDQRDYKDAEWDAGSRGIKRSLNGINSAASNTNLSVNVIAIIVAVCFPEANYTQLACKLSRHSRQYTKCTNT